MEHNPTKVGEPGNDFHDEEKRLMNQLKQVCDDKGQEINVAKSKQILYQLGKLYYVKSKQTPEIITLIQSAALYNAAIARSTSNAQEIEHDLKQLCKYVLAKSGAQNQHADLINRAKQVKKEFENLRLNVKQKLKTVPQITESATQRELEIFEKQKVISIRQLQNDITICYTKIMADVAEYCHGVMGNVQCRFAVIGMGSLARKEITPYSDFEHIIALDDEVANNETKEEIISYFKWFSVVFHIVVINLQETILPSVAIPTLNNFYSEAKQNNWFYDGITTRGISFDGLMPHACKLPIGRQQSTKQKHWKTELIKPVTNMLEYLTVESQLKNGYHLGDILMKTCFVYGDQAIYDQFSAGVVKILNNQSDSKRLESVKCQINDDLESFATRQILVQLYMKNEINIKQIAYRSSTLFIAAMGRLFSIPNPSCFEVIEKLADMNELTEFAKHKQMYAVAIACEIRLRWYMQCESQTDALAVNACDKNAVEKLFSIVGKRSTASYFQIAYALQCDISKRLNLKKIHFHSNPQLFNFNIAICLGLNQSKIDMSKLDIQTTKFIRLYDFDNCLQVLENADSGNLSHRDNDIANTSNALFKQLHQAGDILFESECYDDALEYYQKLLQVLTANMNISSNIVDFSLSEINGFRKKHSDKAESISIILKRIGDCMINIRKANTAIKYLEQSATIQKEASMNNKSKLKLASIFHSLGQCNIDLYDLTKAQSWFEKALQIEEQATTNAETDTSLATTLHQLGRCLLNMNQHTDALKYFQRALQIKERATTNAETDTSLAMTLHSLSRCLLNMNQHTDALKYFQRALQIKERVTTNAETDTSLAKTLHELGRCLLNMNQHTDALKYFQRALQIHERVTTNAESDTSLATTLHQLGRCLLNMNQRTDALKYFQTALQIHERATTNAETDTSLATTLHELGRCLLNMNQHTEALKYFQRALQIHERATTNAETDTSLAKILHQLGRCLRNMNQHTEALKYFQKALEIKERATRNAEIDASLATTLHELGGCLLNMNQHTEALNYFQRALQIKERATTNAATDSSLANTLYMVGCCYSDINKPKKSLFFFEKCLEIKRRSAVDAATDNNVLLTVEQIEKCFLKTAKN